MNKQRLDTLMREYQKAPDEYHATGYWASYEKRILDTVGSMDLDELRSGKYPILASFGFGDVPYTSLPNWPFWKKAARRFVHRHLIKDRSVLPYGLNLSGIRELAFRHCALTAEMTGSVPLSAIEVSDFGHPQDLFMIGGRRYTMSFLGYYLFYCFAQKHISFKGDEILVELGPGAGYQIEVLKKSHPGMTILCFDMPAELFLCEEYLTRALGKADIIGSETTLHWTDLAGIRKGGVHFFGNWQFPLLQHFSFDIFWNSASFGEMEPSVVQNYLSAIRGNAGWIYLLQARHGKETAGKTHVQNPVTLDDYTRWLAGYDLLEEHDAWLAHRRFSQSGGYFEGVWRLRKK